MVSLSNFLNNIDASTDDWTVNFYCYFWISGLFYQLSFLYSNVNYFFQNIISSFSLYELDFQRKNRVSNAILVS